MKKLVKKFFLAFNLEIKKKGFLPMDTRQMRNLLNLKNFYGKINHIDGSIVECGVGKGRTFLHLNFLAFEEKKNRQIFGFDSFEGFPVPTIEDKNLRNPQQGEWSGMSEEDIIAILKSAGFPPDWISKQVTLIKGFFKNTLKFYQGGPIAFLHIDADLYQSYLDVLKQFFPKVAFGGVVLFDEYNEEKWPGAKRAVDEFFADPKYKPIYDLYSGKYYIVK